LDTTGGNCTDGFGPAHKGHNIEGNVGGVYMPCEECPIDILVEEKYHVPITVQIMTLHQIDETGDVILRQILENIHGCYMIEITVFRNRGVPRLNNEGFPTNPFAEIIVGMENGLSIPKGESEFYVEKNADHGEKSAYDKILERFICHIHFLYDKFIKIHGL